MKKIILFSLAYYPRVGGAEVAIKEITRRIPNIEFHILTMRFSSADAAEERIEGITVHRLGEGSSYASKLLFIPRAALRARALHRTLRFDAAWAMMSYMLLPLTLARLGIPYVLTLQEGDTEEHMFGRLRILPFLPLIRLGFRKAAVVQAISTYLGMWACKRGFAGPLEIIPNGVDTELFSRDMPRQQVQEIQEQLGKKMGDVFVITTSRLVRKNAIDDMVRALAVLPDTVHFIVLGTGPDEAMLRKLAAKLNVSKRVQFLGQVGHEKLPAYLKACDIFIRASRSEGMGNSFIEAMAAGIPVVATQEGGIADFLFDEKRNPDKPITGWAVDPDSPAQIAAALQEVMAHPEKMRQVVATAKALVVEKYDWNIIARAMQKKVFSRVLRSK